MTSTYYPSTTDGRADWWQNILDNAVELPKLKFTAAEVTSILNDAAWGVYLYRNVREAYEDAHSAAVRYAMAITDGDNGAPLPVPTAPPVWPAAPAAAIACGLEARREKWVADAKNSTTYTENLGTILKLVGTGSPFDPHTYQAQLFGLLSASPRTVVGKFRKANGNVDGINLYGRKEGSASWTMLGRFNATPFSSLVPLVAASGPEAWEFCAHAVKRDVEIGQASDIVPLLVHG